METNRKSPQLSRKMIPMYLSGCSTGKRKSRPWLYTTHKKRHAGRSCKFLIKSVSTLAFSQQQHSVKNDLSHCSLGRPTEGGMGCQTVGFAHPRPACLPSPALGKLKPIPPARESSLLGSLSLTLTWKVWYRYKESGKLAAPAWNASAARVQGKFRAIQPRLTVSHLYYYFIQG